MKAYLKTVGFAAVLAVLPLASASADLVTNGGFETGDLSGWTLGGATADLETTNAPVHSGTYAGEFGPQTTGTITQILATTPGQAYSLSFWLSNGTSTSSLFEATIVGSFTNSLTNAPAFDFTQFVYNFVATTSSTTLTFAFVEPGSFWWLDDVAVTETGSTTTPSPEPASIALLGAGLAGFGGLRRKRK